MPRLGSSPFSFPDFRGATRRLVLLNIFAYFALVLLQLAIPTPEIPFVDRFGFIPSAFLAHGWLWQPLTYSFVHPPALLIGTALELISLWFMAGFLENLHTPSWVMGLYVWSVLGTAAAATALYAGAHALGYSIQQVALFGCVGGIFGLLVAIGTLYGEMEFLLFFTIGIKAKYLVAIYALISIAMLFGEQKLYAFAQLGGALAGLIYVKLAPRRGAQLVGVVGVSEKWYALRNRYYRWKRRRAARKFEVYMRSQGRTVHMDGQGKRLDDDANDKKRWN
jgi:hypothetical protein